MSGHDLHRICVRSRRIVNKLLKENGFSVSAEAKLGAQPANSGVNPAAQGSGKQGVWQVSQKTSFPEALSEARFSALVRVARELQKL